MFYRNTDVFQKPARCLKKKFLYHQKEREEKELISIRYRISHNTTSYNHNGDTF